MNKDYFIPFNHNDIRKLDDEEIKHHLNKAEQEMRYIMDWKIKDDIKIKDITYAEFEEMFGRIKTKKENELRVKRKQLMSINYLVDDLISEGNSIITSPSGNGTSVLALSIANYLTIKGKSVIYFNPTRDVDSEYIRKYFPAVYSEVFFVKSSFQNLISFISYIDYKIDFLIIDPGDNLMVNKGIFPVLKDLLKNSKLIVTSQIRQDPTMGGKLYSPIEELNKKYNNAIFKYSIWIRDVTESTTTFKSRYIDVFENARKGNDFIRRYIVKFDKKTGVLIG